LGVAICGAMIVWGGIDKTLAPADHGPVHRE
jgi:hypothetical protein